MPVITSSQGDARKREGLESLGFSSVHRRDSSIFPPVLDPPGQIPQLTVEIDSFEEFPAIKAVTDGETSDGSPFHTHEPTNYHLTFAVAQRGGNTGTLPSGYDDSTGQVCINAYGGNATSSISQYRLDPVTQHLAWIGETDVTVVGAGDVPNGGIYIGDDYWASEDDLTSQTIFKNGSGVTFSGTKRSGPLGYDPTNAYLLVLYQSAGFKIEQYSGVGGTTITNEGTITLDASVNETVGFLFDDLKSEYFCLDTSNNQIIRFDSSGTTVDTVSYSDDITGEEGLCFIKNRLYIVLAESIDIASSNSSVNYYSLWPTTYKRV